MSTQSNLILLKGQLEGWAKARKGTVAICETYSEVFGVLSTKPSGFRAAIKAVAETPRDFEEAPLFDRQYWVYLSHGQSMQLQPGENWVRGQAGGEAWGKTVDSCVNFIRKLNFGPTTEENPNYKGWRDITAVHPGLMIEGIVIEFTIGCEPDNI
jgi:hypothetical protein